MNHCIYCHHWIPLDRELVEEGDGLHGQCSRPEMMEWVKVIFVRERATSEGQGAMNAFGALLEEYDCHLVTNARFGCVCWEGEADAE